jgi:hypothetical protein
MSPRNHAACIGKYCNAILINTDRSLLAQFGLTPKSGRGLAARVAVRWSLGVIGGHEGADGRGDMRRSHLKNFDRLRRYGVKDKG